MKWTVDQNMWEHNQILLLQSLQYEITEVNCRSSIGRNEDSG